MSKSKTDQQVDVSSAPLTGNNNFFFGVWSCLYNLRIARLCVNSLITAKPTEKAERIRIQWNSRVSLATCDGLQRNNYFTSIILLS